MFAALEREQKKLWPGAITLPLMQTGATDSAYLRAKGVQAYGIGVPMDDEDLHRVHGNDERVSLKGFAQFTNYLYAVVSEVAGSSNEGCFKISNGHKSAIRSGFGGNAARESHCLGNLPRGYTEG
jgi:hypothetical protein